MEPIYGFIFGAVVGLIMSWSYIARLAGPLPTPAQMKTIVTQAVLAVSNAAIIEGSGAEKAATAMAIMRRVLSEKDMKLNERLLGLIVEAVYQYSRLQERPGIQ